MGIFADNADKHWDAGLPVIPLVRNAKMPAISGWNSYANQMPTDEEKAYWKTQYGEGGIGMPLGPQSGLIGIDIDTDDQRLMAVIERVLPPSPWIRIGRRGKVLIYRYDGQPTIHIRYHDEATDSHKGLVDVLGAGSQVVLPPSIHPDTKLPYTANRELVDVLGEVVSLPVNTETRLREALKEAGIALVNASLGSLTSFVSPGARDNTLMAMAGLFASDVTRGKKSLLDACEQIEAWAENFTAKVYGDNVDPSKGPKKIVECLIKDVTGPKRRMLPKGWDEGLTDDQKEGMGLSIFTTEHETWSVDQIRDYFQAGLEKSGMEPGGEPFMAHFQDTIFKISSNRDLGALEEAALIRWLADFTDKKVSIVDIRRQITEYRAGEIKGIDHTEIAQAVVRDLQELKGEMRFSNGVMWFYCGSHWKVIDEFEILKYIAEEYGSYKAAARYGDHVGICRLMRDLCAIDLKRTELNGINFVNGYLTEDLRLIPHHPDHGMTYCLDYEYDPSQAGKCPRWLAMLHDYWGKDEDYAQKVTALGEAIASTLFGVATRTEKVFCLFGVAHSGKSRILEIVQGLMPEDAQTSITPTLWNDKFMTAPLVGKLLNVAGELSETDRIDSAQFKRVADGQTIDAQYKGQPVFTFRPVAAHWFATNHMPKSIDSSLGFIRRWMFFYFPRPFPIEKKVAEYHKIVIAEERVAIAAWAIQHMPSLLNRSFTMTIPKSCEEWGDRLENDMNSVKAFLSDLREQGRIRIGVDDHTGVKGQSFVTLEQVMTEYRSYCVANGVTHVKLRALSDRLNLLQSRYGFIEEKGMNNLGFLQTQYKYLTFVDRKGRTDAAAPF